jgi:hypothetical protein
LARPGRPRKSGERKNGRLVRSYPSVDRGHPLTIAHRAELLIAGADPRDPRAGYALGRLELCGALADLGLNERDAAEQNYARAEAGRCFGALHAVVWNGRPGRPSPFTRSHLAGLIASACEPLFDLADDDPETIKRRCGKQLREANARACVAGVSNHALRVLENVVIYEQGLRFADTSNRRPSSAWLADQRDLSDLRLALGALVREFKGERRRIAA